MYLMIGATAGLLLLMLMPSAGCAGSPERSRQPAALPEAPREFVETALPPERGQTIHVPADGDLQEALLIAQPGDVITLQPGAVYRGPFVLPYKEGGTGWITIRTAAIDKLPGPGTRVSPSHAPLMPKLVSRRKGGVVFAEKGAHHYRFIGIEVTPQEGAFLYALMWFGENKDRTLEEQAHHIIVDRCYLHGDPQKGSRRGVALNGRHLAVIDSHLSDFKEVGNDSQALMGWSGLGPIKIVNNHLEAAAEDINFGGGDPLIRNLVPSDIEIRHNYLTKPLSWKRGEPGYDGSSWSIKNLFELKNARRVLIDGNVLEYNWEESQNGFAILFTVRNQEGTAPWSAIEDVQFSNNIVRHSGSGVNILGHDDNHAWDQSVETKRLLIKNNLWEDIGGARWGGTGTLFQLLRGTSDITIEHNTAFQTGSLLFAVGPPHKRLVFRHNAAPHNQEGINGQGVGMGTRALEALFPDAIVTGNVIAGGDKDRYPAGNAFPASIEPPSALQARSRDGRAAASNRNQSESPQEPEPGVDIAALCRALGPLAPQERLCGARDETARR